MPTPRELASRLTQKLKPAPQQPQFEYAPWSEPTDMPSERAARLEGARALARSSLYTGPSVEEVREEQRQANAIAAAWQAQNGP